MEGPEGERDDDYDSFSEQGGGGGNGNDSNDFSPFACSPSALYASACWKLSLTSSTASSSYSSSRGESLDICNYQGMSEIEEIPSLEWLSRIMSSPGRGDRPAASTETTGLQAPAAAGISAVNWSNLDATQKMVVKVSMVDEGTRRKAIRIVVGVGAQGILKSVNIEGTNRDELVIVGTGIDAVNLMRQLRRRLGFRFSFTLRWLFRRRVGYVQLISVTVVYEKEKEKDDQAPTLEIAPACHPGGVQTFLYEIP